MAAYGEPDIAALAAAYGFGLAENHPFIDGNKRAAFLAVGLSLMKNGQRLVVSQAEATATVLALSGSEITEEAFAGWGFARTQFAEPERRVSYLVAFTPVLPAQRTPKPQHHPEAKQPEC